MRKVILFILVSLITPWLHAQLAADKCKYLGNIIAASTPPDFTQYWNQVTPENAGKWGSAEPTRDQMSWTQLDNAYNAAKNNNLPFKQHTFVWGQQQPAWLETLTAIEVKAEIEEWISEFCARYPETEYIDVVNEPLHAVPAYKNAIGGDGTTGWDWVVWSFEKARQYCPNAKLLLNDYNIINNNTSTTAYLGIINILKTKGLIDGIGEQGHFLETTPLATIESNLNRLAQTQLPIHISEFDLNIADDVAQKNKYEQLFPLVWEHQAVHGVTLWGYKQGQIWQTNAFLIRTNGSFRPAFTWLKNYVENSTAGALCGGPVLGIERSEIEMDVFPNPVHNAKFTIISQHNGVTLNVINSVGAVVDRRELQLGSNEIEMPWTAGVYVLVMKDQDNKSSYRKILKY